MSRGIEFRAWCKKQKEMRYDIHLSKYFYEFIEFTNDYEVMQYTGLKDKNGVKIFEGDIVKSDGYPAIEVVYDKESCSFKMKVQYIGWTDLLILSSKKIPYIEVIGNIYENPKLLGDNNE